MTSLKIPHRPKSLVQVARDAIRQGIILKELKLGQPLKEASMSQALTISSTPIREALSLLKSEGLVISELFKGYRVFTMNQKELVNFSELRFALESQALRYGIERDLSGLSKKLEKILEEMEKCQDEQQREKYLNLDSSFHKAFFISCSNNFLYEHYESIHAIIETLRHYISISNHATTISLKEHRALVKQISKGRTEDAVQLLEDHIVSWSHRTIMDFS